MTYTINGRAARAAKKRLDEHPPDVLKVDFEIRSSSGRKLSTKALERARAEEHTS